MQADCSKGGSYPNLAALGQTGVNFVDSTTSRPSDSFPDLMALVTGGSPRTVGAYYDVVYDRVLAPPTQTTWNGVAGGACTTFQPNGIRTAYEEGIDLDLSKLNGGASSGDGGINSIDSTRLIRDLYNNCQPVYPWNFIRTNTILAWFIKPAVTLQGPISIRRIRRFRVPATVRTSTIIIRPKYQFEYRRSNGHDDAGRLIDVCII